MSTFVDSLLSALLFLSAIGLRSSILRTPQGRHGSHVDHHAYRNHQSHPEQCNPAVTSLPSRAKKSITSNRSSLGRFPNRHLTSLLQVGHTPQLCLVELPTKAVYDDELILCTQWRRLCMPLRPCSREDSSPELRAPPARWQSWPAGSWPRSNTRREDTLHPRARPPRTSARAGTPSGRGTRRRRWTGWASTSS